MRLIRDLLSLREDTVEDGQKPTVTDLGKLTDADLADLLHKNCKGAMEYLITSTGWPVGDHDDFPTIYRGDKTLSDNSLISTAGSTRKSTGIENYHTAIMDNTPSMKGFPKRGSSLIASTSVRSARFYSHNVFCIVPFDNAKVAVCHTDDIWGALISFMGVKHKTITGINEIFSKAKIEDSWEGIKKFAKELAGDGPEAEKALADLKNACELYSITGTNLDVTLQRAKEDFMGEIDKMFSPSETGFNWRYGRDLESVLSPFSELWIEGEMVAIEPEVYKNTLAAYGKKYT